MPASASQSLVSMSSGVRPTSSMTESWMRMIRLSNNSGIPYTEPSTVTWATAGSRYWLMSTPKFEMH